MSTQQEIDNKEALGALFESMASGIDSERREKYGNHISSNFFTQNKPPIEDQDPEVFYFNYVYPLKQALEEVISRAYPNNSDIDFILINSQFIDSQFEKLFTRYEGMACCADKSRVIVRALFDHFKTGKKITFNYSQKYTFHLPEVIFTNHDEIIKYYSAIKRMYYGDPTDLIIQLGEVIKSNAHLHKK